MRRFIVGGLVMAAVMLGTAGPGEAIPTKGDTVTLTCGDASVTIVTSPGGGDAAWGTDGAVYHLKSEDLRFYSGEFATEPTNVDPVFAFRRTYGNRVGQGAAATCSFRHYNAEHNLTAFDDITATAS
jgi:hypothetical protein